MKIRSAVLAVTALVAGACSHAPLNKASGEVVGIILLANTEQVGALYADRFPGQAECEQTLRQMVAEKIGNAGPPPAGLKVLGVCVPEDQALDLLAHAGK